LREITLNTPQYNLYVSWMNRSGRDTGVQRSKINKVVMLDGRAGAGSDRLNTWCRNCNSVNLIQVNKDWHKILFEWVPLEYLTLQTLLFLVGVSGTKQRFWPRVKNQQQLKKQLQMYNVQLHKVHCFIQVAGKTTGGNHPKDILQRKRFCLINSY
uniref:Uncharacterized protein n=1 Tax=Oncorhynchus mykiss TaxID=8022 RepID=A0A8K9UJR2_ONCMY